MIKRLSSYLGVIVLVLFSFYYTDRAVDIVKRNDPIMKSILNAKDNYEISSVNANVEGDNIIPGVNGLTIDIDESYKRMKKVNGFYESMLTFDEVIPDETILNTYDKFVIKGNAARSEVALVFKVNNLTNLEKIYNILLEKEVLATFFVDGTILENNTDLILEMVKDGYEIENFGYNDSYDNINFEWTNNLIFSLTNLNPKFCYSEYNNYDILTLCSKSKMYTIKPTILINSNPFTTIKNNLNNGVIYSLNMNEETVKELRTAISYVKQKGYDLVTISDIILENRILEK